MYEATISVTKNNLHLLGYVKRHIEPCIKEVDGITSDLAEKNRDYFSFACSDTYRFQIQRNLSSAVSEALSLGYKNVFMRDLLGIDYSDFYRNVLVNTICVFDNEYDKQQVSKLIEIDKPVCLDGYYNFRLSSLKRKWEEVSRLVCENGYILSDKELITEFLQYLLESVPSKVKQLSVNFEKDNYFLYNSANKVMRKLDSLAQKCTAEEEAMLNVICLKPQSVKIYSDGNLSEPFCTLMDELFQTEYIHVQ